jgi:protein-S-isoprenylcysteine O-methyltransferase Ste14
MYLAIKSFCNIKEGAKKVIDNDLETIYLIGLLTGSMIRKWYLREFSRKEQMNAIKGPDGPLLILSAIAMFILPITYIFTQKLDFANYNLSTWLGWLGAPFFAIALWLLWRSHKDLGKNFSLTTQTKEKQTLVTTGVYKKIRHPMYTAHLVWAIAQAILLQNWIAGPTFLLSNLLLYIRRIPIEEEMMIKEFGNEYQKYMEKTGRLLPKF